jgi:uncharacterized membrane protein
MGAFTLALAGFVLLLLAVSAAGGRDVLVRRIGEGPSRALFLLALLALLAWLFAAYDALRADPFDPLNELFWMPPRWTQWPAGLLSALGIILGVAGAPPAPASAPGEPARGVFRITRHPILWGLALWGAGHLLANGERFAVMLFGALTFTALYAARALDRQARTRDAEAWAAWEAATSNVPFAAILQRRNRLAPRELWLRLFLGAAVVLIAALAHQSLFGAPAISTSP